MSVDAIVNWTLLLTTFTTLIVIIDPPGTIPVFMALTAKMDRAEKRRAAAVAALTSFGIILTFALVGKYVLGLLHISFPALQLSGGFLLFLVAMQLLMGFDVASPDQTADPASAQPNVALVPLGTPLLAGPGAIVAVMVAIDQGGGQLSGWISVLVAVVIAHIAIWATMFFSVYLSRLLGESGLLLLTRISGLLLAAIATQMIAEAIYEFIASYPG